MRRPQRRRIAASGLRFSGDGLQQKKMKPRGTRGARGKKQQKQLSADFTDLRRLSLIL
jgi:hypothetical protein